MTHKTLQGVLREALTQAYSSPVLNERDSESTGDADVDRVAMFLDKIIDREEMLLAIPLMFKKIMAYEDHNVSTGEFREAIVDSFPHEDDAVVLFNILSKVGQHDEEEHQDVKDREDERLAAKDRKASDRADADDKYSQNLADRRHESEGATKKRQPQKEGLGTSSAEDIVYQALRDAFRRLT